MTQNPLVGVSTVQRHVRYKTYVVNIFFSEINRQKKKSTATQIQKPMHRCSPYIYTCV